MTSSSNSFGGRSGGGSEARVSLRCTSLWNSGSGVSWPIIATVSQAVRSTIASAPTSMTTTSSTPASEGGLMRRTIRPAMRALNAAARRGGPKISFMRLRLESLERPAFRRASPPAGLRACVDRLAYVGLSRLWPKAGEDPGCAGGLPRADVGAGVSLHDEVERGSAGRTQRTDLVRELGERIRSRELDREQAIPASRTPHWAALRPARRDPHWDSWTLHGERLELTAPKRVQPVETLIEQPRPFARVDDLPERLELVVAITTQPHAERKAPATELVERHRLPGELVDSSPRERGDHRPQPEPLGGRRDCGQRHPGVRNGTDGLPICDVVPQEEAIPTPRFCAARELGEHPWIHDLVERCEEDSALDAHARGPISALLGRDVRVGLDLVREDHEEVVLGRRGQALDPLGLVVLVRGSHLVGVVAE